MLTGKLFEYIASGRPILCLGPADGDAAAVINNTSTGEIAEWDDVEKIKATLKKYHAMYKANELKAHPIHLEKYHRKNLTQELIKILT